MIRLAQEADLPAVDDIYNQAIARRFCTADLKPIEMKRRHDWWQAHDPQRYPIYVYLIDTGQGEEQIAGWVSLSAYRTGREALQDVAEISYYVDDDHQGQGLGSQLVEFAIQAARQMGKRVLFAAMIEGNAGSMALAKKFGFDQWGYIPEAIRCFGETRGHVYMGKLLEKA